eukprot:PITA_12435
MDSDKAPGPDGFTIHFYKMCWDIIKTDLLKIIKGFRIKAKVGGGTNFTYLVLIPKELNPKTFARFRPMSLCNASYKILVKLLANRIKPFLKRLISSNQGGFIEGRHILDNVIQVQEIIHSSQKRKEKGMLIKLDMANAFDRVNQAFLYKFLLAFGFSPHFVALIKACTDSPWIAPLILSAEKAAGSLPGLKLSIHSLAQNHALFADDSLLLGGASPRIAKAFDEVLKCYCRVSGASINERKSVVYGWNIDQQELTSISALLGFNCQAQWETIKHLGLPIINGCNKRALWSEVISKIKTKITSWGGYWLTSRGKVILIKSVLSALPIYQAAFLLAPKQVTDHISKLIRDFLWQGGKGNTHKMHLVKWD